MRFFGCHCFLQPRLFLDYFSGYRVRKYISVLKNCRQIYTYKVLAHKYHPKGKKLQRVPQHLLSQYAVATT